MPQLSKASIHLADVLFRDEIIRFNAFSRRHTAEAPFRCNWHELNTKTHPLALWLLLEKLEQTAWAFSSPCQLITSDNTAIWPLAMELADKLRLQFFEPAFCKDEELSEKCQPGQYVLVLGTGIDDKLMATIEALGSKDLRVSDALVLLDYGNKDEIKLKIKSHCRLHVIFILPHLLDFFLSKGCIGRPSYEIIQQWLAEAN